MAYRLQQDEQVRIGITRCGQEQLTLAVRALSHRIGEDPVDAVHAARKAVKKERSLLRLVRGSIAGPQRRRDNAALRQAGRELSDARDAEVMIDTLDQLTERYVGQLPDTTFNAVRAQLERVREEHRERLLDSARGDRAVRQLTAVRDRVEDWRLRGDGWAALETGLARSYADGRAALSRARSDRSPETLHALRKRVKDLWYQERLLSEVGGPAVAGQAKDAHVLSDLLGDDHDLVVLREALTSGRVQAPADVGGVVALIDHRRAELQARALRLAGRVYAEKPKAFVRRMGRAWTAGHARAAAQRDQHPAELAAATRAPHPV